MEILSQTDTLLRESGFRTTRLSPELLCFEDDCVIGFVNEFPDATRLLSQWSATERANLTRFAPQLRSAPNKAWNVYSILLCQAPAQSLALDLERIEENLTFTRKIVRAGIASRSDLERAIMPLLPVRSSSAPISSDYAARLRKRLTSLPPETVELILGNSEPTDIARLMIDRS